MDTLEYAGSKAGIAPVLDLLLPENTRTLVSPFFGSGKAEYRLLRARPHLRCLASDLDPFLVCFHQQGIADGPALAQAIMSEGKRAAEPDGSMSRETFERFGDARSLGRCSPLVRAARVYLRQRASYGGTFDRQKGQSARYSLVPSDRVLNRMVSERWPNMQVRQEDALRVLSGKPPPKSITFLDPPYMGNVPGYRVGRKDAEWHRELHRVLRATQHFWMMTLNDTPAVRDMYEDWCTLILLRRDGFVKHVTSGELIPSPRKELLIVCPRLENWVRKQVQTARNVLRRRSVQGH